MYCTGAVVICHARVHLRYCHCSWFSAPSCRYKFSSSIWLSLSVAVSSAVLHDLYTVFEHTLLDHVTTHQLYFDLASTANSSIQGNPSNLPYRILSTNTTLL